MRSAHHAHFKEKRVISPSLVRFHSSLRFLKIAQLRMKRTAHAHENVKNELSMYENMDLKKKDEENL